MSGFAALLFELLLFRRLELVLGRSLTASAVILAAYMLGLGLGAYAVSHHRLAAYLLPRPAGSYACVELFAGMASLALVLALPFFVAVVGSDFAAFLTLTSLLLPTIAMGMAMPLLCEVALRDQAAFTQAFHRLYALNTLGAMAGAGLGLLLIRQFGIPIAALLAASANALAASVILLARQEHSSPGGDEVTVDKAFAEDQSARMTYLLVAACGFLILALEVIWLRALVMHASGTDALFALLLASVIGGLSLGASLAQRLSLSAWLQTAAWGAVIPCFYLMLWPQALPLLLTVLILSLPCSLASGAIFSRCMAMLRRQRQSSVQASSQLYLINTVMAAIGALLAAWVLLPLLGIGRAWLLCALLFALLAFCVAPARRMSLTLGVSLIVLLAYRDPGQLWADQALSHFPDHKRQAELVVSADASLQLARRDLNGQAVAWRLLTDGYSMSGTEFDSLRYMRLFAMLPQALHAEPQEALLISYGVGTTAAALLSDQRLKRLDIVDTSHASVELSQQIFVASEKPSPLDDPRTQLHIDDGRHHLLASNRRWDIITAEPPPPRLAGVVNLYTQDYFELIYQRLSPGGLSTHWLPVDQLSMRSTQAIVRAFCNVFSDCSLWAGSHYNWVLMGGREYQTTQSRAVIFQQAPALSLLREIGLERPSQLLATFLADATQLQAWIGSSPALNDDHPGRLQSHGANEVTLNDYFAWMDDVASQQRFEQSEWAQQLWAVDLHQSAQQDWMWQPVLNGQVQLDGGEFARSSLAALQSGLRMPLVILAGLSLAELSAVQKQNPLDWPWHHAIMALVNGNWVRAQDLLQLLPDARAQALRACLRQNDCLNSP